MLDVSGTRIVSGFLLEPEFIDMSLLARGIYFVRVGWHKRQFIVR